MHQKCLLKRGAGQLHKWPKPLWSAQCWSVCLGERYTTSVLKSFCMCVCVRDKKGEDDAFYSPPLQGQWVRVAVCLASCLNISANTSQRGQYPRWWIVTALLHIDKPTPVGGGGGRSNLLETAGESNESSEIHFWGYKLPNCVLEITCTVIILSLYTWQDDTKTNSGEDVL